MEKDISFIVKIIFLILLFYKQVKSQYDKMLEFAFYTYRNSSLYFT